jgi:antitoxin component YwqK of YwqJK toxin-antitoxin module
MKKYAETGDLMYQIRYYDTDVFEYSYLDANGKLLPPIPLKGGNGQLRAKYSNGKPSAEINFEASDYMGNHINWHPNGNKVYESPEDHDLTHGIQKKWYADGTPRSTTVFWNNMMLGKHQTFHPNGKLKAEGEYYLDKQHGTWRYYDLNGKLVKTESYYYGRLLEIKKP